MAVESPPAFLQSGSYGAEQTRRAVYSAMLQRGATIGSVIGGLVAAGDCVITAPGSGMSCNIAPGELIVPGSSASTQSGYGCRVTSTSNLAIAAADPSQPRVDRISAIVADAAYAGGVNNFSVAVETGTPTAGANVTVGSGGYLAGVAAAPASSLTLGYVLVPATSTNVTAGNIANVATVVNAASIADYGAAFSTYKSIEEREGSMIGTQAASTLILDAASAQGGTATQTMVAVGTAAFADKAFYFDPADWTAGSRTTKLFVRAQLIVGNGTPGITFTVGLYPVSTYGVNANGLPTIATLGAVTASSTVAFTTPAATTRNQGNSGDFTAPAAGYYVLGVVLSGTTPAGSGSLVRAALQMRQV